MSEIHYVLDRNALLVRTLDLSNDRNGFIGLLVMTLGE